MCAKVRMISRYLLVSCGLILVSFVHASSLPADGGEPGKAYKACVDAVAKPDKAAMFRFVLQRMIRGSKRRMSIILRMRLSKSQFGLNGPLFV